jgi:phospholipase/carboxylesterase
VRVQWQSYAMPHSVCAEEIRDLGDWLTTRFAGES